MFEPLSTALIVAGLILTAVTLGYVALDRSPDWMLLGLVALVEVGLLALLVAAIVEVAGDAEVAEPIVFVGYAGAALLMLPFGVLWSLSERSRGATSALAAAAFTTAFLVIRMLQVHA